MNLQIDSDSSNQLHIFCLNQIYDDFLRIFHGGLMPLDLMLRVPFHNEFRMSRVTGWGSVFNLFHMACSPMFPKDVGA